MKQRVIPKDLKWWRDSKLFKNLTDNRYQYDQVHLFKEWVISAFLNRDGMRNSATEFLKSLAGSGLISLIAR